MKIGIISDTHGFFHPLLPEVFAGVDYILHAGDVGRASVIRELDAIAPTIAVRGNIDGEEFYYLEKLEHRILDGIRVALVHNAGDMIRPAFDLHTRILNRPTDILISGHYHGYWCSQVDCEHGKVLWLSPGAAGNSGHHLERTALLLTIAPVQERTGDIRQDAKLEKIHLGARGYGV